jgi:hypothetical protein
MALTHNNNTRPSHSLTPIDWVLSVLILVSGTLLGKRYSVGPIAWDDTLYLHTAMTLARDPTILNRYLHVFILRLGIFLEGGVPLAGAYLAGAFIFCLTASLVYLNARILSGADHPWHGVMALLFLLSAPYYLLNFGSSLADFSLMAMLNLGILCFLLAVRSGQESLFMFSLNGLVFFLAIKCKEAGVILVFLLAALLIVNNRPFRWRATLFRAGAILVGIAAGQIGFIVLDGLLLKDAWFGLRAGDIQALLAFNSQPSRTPQIGGTYFTAISQISLLAPFCLSLISAANRRETIKSGDWPVYSLPLGFFAMVIITQIKFNYGVMDRYTIPALTVLAVIAPQFMQFGVNRTENDHKIKLLSLPMFLGVIAVIMAYLLSLGLYASVGQAEYRSQADFITTILEPLGFVILLSAAWLVPSKKTWGFLILVGAIAFLTLPTIQLNRMELGSGKVKQASLDRLAPMMVFNHQVKCTHGPVFVSQNYHDQLNLLSRDQQSTFWMFDLSFNCSSQIDQFTISHSPKQVLENHYLYAFLPKDDFDNLMSQEETAVRVGQSYSITSNAGQTFYLLIGK